MILVSTLATGGLQRVPANGGIPAQVTTLDKSRDEVAHLFPYFLPDGRHFLYLAQSIKSENTAIYLGALDSSDRTMLVRSEGFAQFAPPTLVLNVRGNALMAQELNLETLTLAGEPTLIANRVYILPNGRAGFSVSGGGVLVYHGIPAGPTQHLLWIDRAGKTIESIAAPNAAFTVRLSGDGKHVALDEAPFGVSGTISSYDIERGINAPLITDASGGFFTAWSPDGGKLVYASGMVRGDSGSSLYEKQSNGATAGHQILATEPGVSLSPQDESSDGNILVFTKGIRNQRQLWALPLSGDRKPFQYLADSFDQPQAALSPNGRFLAYTSNESGRYQVVVQPFPNSSGGKWQISVAGGSSRNGDAMGKKCTSWVPMAGSLEFLNSL